jgi:hypothetical protein
MRSVSLCVCKCIHISTSISIPSCSQELLNSRAKSSRLPSDTPRPRHPAPQRPHRAVGPPYTAWTLTTACDAPLSLHSLRCAAHFTLRHDILKGMLRLALHRAGIASTLEPPLRQLPCLNAGAGTSADGSAIRPEARSNILLALPQGISITGISVIHPLSINIISRAATTAGAAASHRDQRRRTAYARVEPHGYGFIPFSVETYGRLGQLAMKLLHLLGGEAASPGGVTRASFMHGALRELSVGLCTGNFLAYQASAGTLARSSGASFRACLSVPTNESME